MNLGHYNPYAYGDHIGILTLIIIPTGLIFILDSTTTHIITISILIIPFIGRPDTMVDNITAILGFWVILTM